MSRLSEGRRRQTVRPMRTVFIKAGKLSPSAWQPSPQKRGHGKEGARGASRGVANGPGPSTSGCSGAAGVSGSGVSPCAVVSPLPARPRPASSAYSIDSLLASPTSIRSPSRPTPRRPVPAPPPPLPPPARLMAPSQPPPPPLPPHAYPAAFASHQSQYMHHYLQTVQAYGGLERLYGGGRGGVPPGYLLYNHLSQPAPVLLAAPLLARCLAGPVSPQQQQQLVTTPRRQLPSPAHQASLHSPGATAAALVAVEQDVPLNLSLR